MENSQGNLSYYPQLWAHPLQELASWWLSEATSHPVQGPSETIYKLMKSWDETKHFSTNFSSNLQLADTKNYIVMTLKFQSFPSTIKSLLTYLPAQGSINLTSNIWSKSRVISLQDSMEWVMTKMISEMRLLINPHRPTRLLNFTTYFIHLPKVQAFKVLQSQEWG